MLLGPENQACRLGIPPPMRYENIRKHPMNYLTITALDELYGQPKDCAIRTFANAITFSKPDQTSLMTLGATDIVCFQLGAPN